MQDEWVNQKRFQDEQDARRDQLLYTIYAAVANLAGARPSVKPREFDSFLRYQPDKQIIELDGKSAEQFLKGWAMAMGGTVS